MRHNILPALALVVAACGTGAAPLTEEDIAALDAMSTAWRQGIMQGDADAVAALFAEDGVLLVSDAPAAEGRAAIRAALEPTPGVVMDDFTATQLELVGYGDLAVSRGTWSQAYHLGEAAVALRGKYMAMGRKQADGSWLLTAHIWNTDTPWPPTPPPEE